MHNENIPSPGGNHVKPCLLLDKPVQLQVAHGALTAQVIERAGGCLPGQRYALSAATHAIPGYRSGKICGEEILRLEIMMNETTPFRRKLHLRIGTKIDRHYPDLVDPLASGGLSGVEVALSCLAIRWN